MLYSIPDFVSLNARFMDAVIRRWEMLLEHAIHLRNGQLSPEEAEQAFDSIRASTVESDMELGGLRNEAQRSGWSFPLDDLVRSYELDAVERQILELALMPHLDLTFRRRLARFNNNILLDFVDVDLSLMLLFSTRTERLQARRHPLEPGAEAALVGEHVRRAQHGARLVQSVGFNSNAQQDGPPP